MAFNDGTCLCVRGLPPACQVGDLDGLFRVHGRVSNIHLPVEPVTKGHRGYAFVTMSSPRSAQACIVALSGVELGGRRIVVEISRRSAPHSKTPGVYHGAPLDGQANDRGVHGGRAGSIHRGLSPDVLKAQCNGGRDGSSSARLRDALGLQSLAFGGRGGSARGRACWAECDTDGTDSEDLELVARRGASLPPKDDHPPLQSRSFRIASGALAPTAGGRRRGRDRPADGGEAEPLSEAAVASSRCPVEAGGKEPHRRRGRGRTVHRSETEPLSEAAVGAVRSTPAAGGHETGRRRGRGRATHGPEAEPLSEAAVAASSSARPRRNLAQTGVQSFGHTSLQDKAEPLSEPAAAAASGSQAAKTSTAQAEPLSEPAAAAAAGPTRDICIHTMEPSGRNASPGNGDAAEVEPLSEAAVAATFGSRAAKKAASRALLQSQRTKPFPSVDGAEAEPLSEAAVAATSVVRAAKKGAVHTHVMACSAAAAEAEPLSEPPVHHASEAMVQVPPPHPPQSPRSRISQLEDANIRAIAKQTVDGLLLHFQQNGFADPRAAVHECLKVSNDLLGYPAGGGDPHLHKHNSHLHQYHHASVIHAGCPPAGVGAACRDEVIVAPEDFKNPSSFLRIYGDPLANAARAGGGARVGCGGGGGQPESHQDGNWRCEPCGNVNFPRRQRCHKCQSMRGPSGDAVVLQYCLRVYDALLKGKAASKACD